MRFLAAFGLSLLVGLAACAPTSKESDEIVIDKDFFDDQFAVYTAKHDIEKILVPLNNLNFDDDDSKSDSKSNESSDEHPMIFFVLADNKDGVKEYKGLYQLKDGKSKKILANGRDAAATNDDTKHAYFAAEDGLYIYNADKETAEKYGSVTDSIIGIAKENGTDAIYILTEGKEVYKVTEQGTKKTKVEGVENAQEIVLDYSNNLYFYNADKQPFVLTPEGVKKFEGLPENPKYVRLLKPPFIIEDGVPFVSGKKSFVLYANGTTELTDFVLSEKPSAYAMEAALFQFYGYNKKIYEYNILALILGTLLDELKNYLNENIESIQSIASRSRSTLRT